MKTEVRANDLIAQHVRSQSRLAGREDRYYRLGKPGPLPTYTPRLTRSAFLDALAVVLAWCGVVSLACVFVWLAVLVWRAYV